VKVVDRKTPVNEAALRQALEAAGVEFVDEKSAVMEVISVARKRLRLSPKVIDWITSSLFHLVGAAEQLRRWCERL
jgi:hypothetical protein